MQNPLVSSILLLVAALVGYVIGVMARRKQNADEAQAALAENDPAAAPLPVPDAAPAPLPAAAVSPAEEAPLPGEHIALRVLIDKKLRWHLDLDGERLEDRPENLTPEQKQRLLNVVIQIRPWLEGKTAAPAAAPAPAPAPAPLVTPPAAPTRISLGESFRAVLQSEVQGKKAPPPAIVSVVSLIDDILQKNIADTPLAARKIKLEEGGIGEVMVWIGPTRYALDAAPDPEIKAAIQRAIAEFNQGK